MGAYLAHRRISVAKIIIKQAYDTIPPPAGVDPFTDTEHARDGAAAHGRVVPGVMVYAMAEGLLTHTMEGTGLAFLHADFVVKGPTFVGDTIHVEVEIIEARLTSKPGRGLVRSRNRVLKADGSECIVYELLRMLRQLNATQ